MKRKNEAKERKEMKEFRERMKGNEGMKNREKNKDTQRSFLKLTRSSNYMLLQYQLATSARDEPRNITNFALTFGNFLHTTRDLKQYVLILSFRTFDTKEIKVF